MKLKLKTIIRVGLATVLIALFAVGYARHRRIAKILALAKTSSIFSNVSTRSRLPDVLLPLEEFSGLLTFHELREVELVGVDIPPNLFDFFHNASSVTVLLCEISEQDLNHLLLNSNDLKYVSLTMVSTTRSGNEKLRFPSTIETLHLSGDICADGVVKNFPEFRELKELWLMHSDRKLTDKSCEVIARFQSLERLRLVRTGINDEGLQELSSLPRLSSLYLQENQRIRHLHALSKFPSLNAICVYGCPITDDSANGVAASKNLDSIFLAGNSFTDDFLYQLAETGLPNLEKFYINGNTEISDAGVRAVIDSSKRLKAFVLEVCGLSEEEMSKLRAEYPKIDFDLLSIDL